MQVPNASASSARRPWGFLGMLALVWCAEACVDHQRIAFQDMTNRSWEMSGRAATREAMSCSVLAFGDSLLKFGIDPRVIERETGISSYNLAVNAGRAPTSYLLLRRALASGSRPKAVLIDFEPNILARPPLANPELWAELVTPRECLELSWRARDSGFLARVAAARACPSVRYRFSIRDLVLERLRSGAGSSSHATSLHADGVAEYCGAVVAPHETREPVALEPTNPVFFPAEWRCDHLNGHFLKRFFALASSRGIPVFWVIPPYTRAIQSGRERGGQDAAFTRLASSIRRRYPTVTVLDARRMGYDDAVFWDGMVHLDELGASVLSTQAAAILKPTMTGNGGSGWVSLPPSRERSAAPASVVRPARLTSRRDRR